jgi:hypothetical protein
MVRSPLNNPLPPPLNAKRFQQAWPFALLCLIASTIWLLLDRYPQISFTLSTYAIASAVAGGLVYCVTRRVKRLPSEALLAPASGGALILIGPTIGTFLGATSLGASGLTIALALTPVVVAVAWPALTERQFYLNQLWPGIVAAAALLIAIPAPSTADWRSDASMALAPLLTGIGCVLYARSDVPVLWKATASLALATILFTIGVLTQSFAQHAALSISLSAISIATVLFLLALLALSRFSAMQYTARYTLVPLVLLMEGPLLLSRSLLTWRAILCAALLLLATVALLRTPAEENVSLKALEDA